MEKPFYGRTGLLTEIGFVADRTVTTNTTLNEEMEGNVLVKTVEDQLSNRIKSAKQTLKWQPTLLMLPQSLLDYFLHVDEASLVDENEFGVDVSLANYLRLSCITEILWKVQNVTSAQERKVYCGYVFRWFNAHRSQLRETSKVLNGKLSWYVPSYDLVTFHDGKEVYRRRNISYRAVMLIGKDENINHYILRQNGCSSQHAVMHINFVFAEEEKMISYVEEYVMHRKNNNINNTHGNDHSVANRDCNTKMQSGSQNILEWSASEKDDIVSCAWNALINLEQTGDVPHDANMLKETDQDQRAKCISAHKFAELWSVELMITDLASTNGTIVEGEKLKPFTPFRLIEGDHISFVGSPFTYMITRSMTELS